MGEIICLDSCSIKFCEEMPYPASCYIKCTKAPRVDAEFARRNFHANYALTKE